MASKRGKRKDIRCPNCGKRVGYHSQHCEGSNELDAVWTCKKAKRHGE